MWKKQRRVTYRDGRSIIFELYTVIKEIIILLILMAKYVVSFTKTSLLIMVNEIWVFLSCANLHMLRNLK